MVINYNCIISKVIAVDIQIGDVIRVGYCAT